MTESARVAAAHEAAAARAARSGEQLRPITGAVLVFVGLTTISATPQPSLDGRGIGVLVALVVYTAGLLTIACVGRPRRGVLLLLTLAAGAGALSAQQHSGGGEIAACLPVFSAFLWCERPQAWAVAVATVVATLGATVIGPGSSASDIVANTVLFVLMGATATLMKRSREDQERTEVLYAELQDARDAQAQAAAIAERGRIAGELHDVLAHSLSGAAIQLQGARRLIAREDVAPQATAAVDRAAELVRDGLADARRAVDALRGEALPTAAQLPALVASLRDDLGLDVALEVRGEPVALSPEAGLALYRGTQEALTNAARHAPGSAVTATLVNASDHATLEIADRGATDGASAPDGVVGGGHGLESMRERVARAGGRVSAGPAEQGGWRVQIEVPAE